MAKATTRPDKPFTTDIEVRKHTIVSDVEATLLGADLGPSPGELQEGLLAACTAMTISAYARKKKLNVTSISVEVTQDKIDDPNDQSEPKRKIIRVQEKVKIEGTVSDAELAALKAAGETCKMTAWALAPKTFESTIERV